MGFDGFYVAAVMVVNGSIWMYAEIIVANDYGPLALFTADSPAGPYTNRGEVLVGGGPGSWDHAQYSESKVEYRAGVFHLFFSAGNTPPAGRRRLGDAWETTGYAFSFDGLQCAPTHSALALSLFFLPQYLALRQLRKEHQQPRDGPRGRPERASQLRAAPLPAGRASHVCLPYAALLGPRPPRGGGFGRRRAQPQPELPVRHPSPCHAWLVASNVNTDTCTLRRLDAPPLVSRCQENPHPFACSAPGSRCRSSTA